MKAPGNIGNLIIAGGILAIGLALILRGLDVINGLIFWPMIILASAFILWSVIYRIVIS